MRRLRAALTEDGRYPCQRTWQRRLNAIPERLPAQIGCLGRHLVATLAPWRDCGRAGAIDSTPLHARGGVWHKKDREAGVVPHTSIDTEAHWTKSGWHGWVYGWKLHLVTTVASVWIPLAATLTAANRADNVDERILVTSQPGPYPHRDAGVEVRRVFHALRSRAIENFNGQFKAIFDCQRPVPTRGLPATRRFVLGAVLVYQLTLLYRVQTGGDLRVGLKPFLQAA